MNLDANFGWAHKWGCVLLLDEADIFLQKRDKSNITRNSIVSVSLRTLEYYSGILILTTNRVGTFHPAFRSRIHVSLYYPPLRKDATMQIWNMHLAQAVELKDKDMKIHTNEMLNFASKHCHELKKARADTWNGRYVLILSRMLREHTNIESHHRQIRNAFQTAIALAKFRATEDRERNGNIDKHRVELGQEHFKIVAQASKDFDMYLKHTLGGQTEADQAQTEQTRMDDHHDRHEGKSQKRRAAPKKKGKKESDNEESEDGSEASGFVESQKAEGESQSEEEPKPRKMKKKQSRK